MDGGRVLVGEPFDSNAGRGVGQAHLFDATTGAVLQTLNKPAVTNFDQFGFSVALSGAHALIGAPGDDTQGSSVGRGYVFEAGTGALLRTLDDPTPSFGDAFGTAVALTSTLALIGAPRDRSTGDPVGQAYLFDIASGGLLQTFTDPTPTLVDGFGSSVALEGSTALMGAPSDSSFGSSIGQAFAFDVTTGALIQTFNDPTPTVGSGDAFGTAVAISGERVLVGAPRDRTIGNLVGQAHLFDLTTGALLQTFNDPTPTTADLFGSSVAIDGTNVLVGAWSDDTNRFDGGQAYLFDAVTGALLQTLNDPFAGLDARFGYSVALDGGKAAVGAPGSEVETGVRRGHVHVFGPTTLRWIDAAGGSFQEAGNWEADAVPGPDDEVLFDLAGSYAVTLAENVRVAAATMSAGDVTLRPAGHRLEIDRLSVGNDAAAATSVTFGEIAPGGFPPPPTGVADTVVTHGDPVSVGANAKLIFAGPDTRGIVEAGMLVGSAAGQGEVALIDAARVEVKGEITVAPGAVLRVANEALLLSGTELKVSVSGQRGDPVLDPDGNDTFNRIGRLVLERSAEAELQDVEVQAGEVSVTGGSRLELERLEVLDGVVQVGVEGAAAGWLVSRDGVDLRGESEFVRALLHLSGTDAPGSAPLMWTGEGTVTVGSDFLIPGALGAALVIEDASAELGGALRVEPGGELEVRGEHTQLQLGGPLELVGMDNFPSLGRALVEGGAEVLIDAEVRIGRGASLALRDRAELSLTGREMEVVGELHLDGARVYQTGGELRVDGAVWNGGGSVNVGAGTAVAGAVRVGPGGRLTGTGTIHGVLLVDWGDVSESYVTADAVLAPGNSPGTLTVDGDAELRGILEIEVAGPDLFDRLVVTGDLLLGGELHLSFIDLFLPTEDALFEFLEVAGNIEGSFERVVVAGLPPDRTFDLVRTSGGFALATLGDVRSGVPSPTTLTLLPLGLVLLHRLRRKTARPGVRVPPSPTLPPVGFSFRSPLSPE